MNTKKSDDYAAFKETIRRRLLKIDSYSSSAILIIVTMVKGKLLKQKVVELLEVKTYQSLEYTKVLIGLQNDKILNSYNDDITNIINKDALVLIQSIRDEVHRFAILNQRKGIINSCSILNLMVYLVLARKKENNY